MTPVELLWAIQSRFETQPHPEIASVSCDSDNDSGEIIFTLTNGQDLAISSGSVRESEETDALV